LSPSGAGSVAAASRSIDAIIGSRLIIRLLPSECNLWPQAESLRTTPEHASRYLDHFSDGGSGVRRPG
jgi:hypothetical protein